VDDASEENDVAQLDLRPVISSPRDPVEVSGLVACPADPDLLLAYGDCCQPAGVTVRWDGTEGDLQIELLDSSGEPYSLDESGDVRERSKGYVRLWRATHGGYFFVRVKSLGKRVRYSAEVLARVYIR
jgi:hypothetical protein